SDLVGVPSSVASPAAPLAGVPPTSPAPGGTASTPSTAPSIAPTTVATPGSISTAPSIATPGSIPSAPSIASPFGTPTIGSMFGGAPAFSGDNPFGATSIESVPGFESTRVPMFDAIAPDAAPYFVPDANHLAIEPAPSDFELRSDDPLVRDLGR